ncbi:hypothetical protein PBY51_008766 [Eleginops maclovinus]|uniref:Uncharacterized protein n=1 Tax=Eleginops maclovinus TaxID=56733 RepID=A0AAN7WUQ8_ELEMC|nr:hypothetical protein PBY51_008766 [Eleginops maclovinus]
MSHMKRFQGIPMSKSMRGLCKEEDFVFLGMSEKMKKDGTGDSENNFTGKQDDRARRKQEREQLEKKRLQEIEDSKKEKEEQWKTHVQELTSSQEKVLQERLARLKTFREFQKKVLVEESAMEDREAGLNVNRLLTRM